jgi:hypothetical protein
LKQEGPQPCFAVGIEFAVSRNTAYLSVFSRMRNITFVENAPIQLKGRCSVDSVRESFMFEVRGPRNLFCSLN